MPEQLCLQGLEPKEELDFLFFGLLLEKGEASRITQLREGLCRECGLQRRGMIASDRLHVSLHGVCRYDGLPQSVVQRAVDAGALISGEPFKISFTRAMSFVRNGDTFPFVLRAVRDASLMDLHRIIGDAMKRVGFRRVSNALTPHLTLLYDRQLVAEREIEPIHITVRRLVLVHSLQGRGIYNHLGRWPLRSRDFAAQIASDLEKTASPVYAKSRSAVHQGVAVPQGVLNLPV